MKKLLLLLVKPANEITEADATTWTEVILQEAKVIAANLEVIAATLNRVDQHVAAAAELAMHCVQPAPSAMLSLWLQDEVNLASLLRSLRDSCAAVYGYWVDERHPLQISADHILADGQVVGMNQIVLLRVPETLTYQDWLNYWLDTHTSIAIETQTSFGYCQNIVLEALDSNCPDIAGIVEENFPDAAMSDISAFYRGNDSAEVKENEKRMLRSCFKFIDFQSLDRLPMTSYRLTP